MPHLLFRDDVIWVVVFDLHVLCKSTCVLYLCCTNSVFWQSFEFFERLSQKSHKCCGRRQRHWKVKNLKLMIYVTLHIVCAVPYWAVIVIIVTLDQHCKESAYQELFQLDSKYLTFLISRWLHVRLLNVYRYALVYRRYIFDACLRSWRARTCFTLQKVLSTL